MPKPVVVIADSSEFRRQERRTLLERGGFRVFEVAAASAILPCVARCQPVLVLLAGELTEAAEMPDVCRQLKAEAGAPLVLSIASTESTPCAGADIYLREPLDAEALAATVATCARLRGQATEFAGYRCAEAARREQDERLRAAVEAAEVGTWWIDLETGLESRDAQVNRILGLSAESSIVPIATRAMCIHPDDRVRVEAALRRLMAEGTLYEEEFRILCPDGTVRWVRDRGRIIRDATGKPAHAAGALVDITERNQTKEMLDRRLAEIEAIYSTAPVGLCVIDTEFRYVRINQRLAELNGLPVEAHLGRTGRDIIPEVADQAKALIRRVIETGEPVLDAEMSVAMPARPDAIRHFVTHWHPLKEGEKTVAINVVVEDVTAHKEAEAALNTLNESLTLADRRKDEFLAMLAHELRNPLAPIRAVVRILHDLGPVDSRLEWARNVIDRQVNHLVRLVDDLLDVSRLVQGKIGLRKESVDLADIVEHALETSRPLIQGRRHHLVISLPGESLPVSGDPVRLVQIVQNLLNNAAKYTPESGRLRLEAYREHGRAVIRVRDTGAGIAPDLLPRIFELFTQAERSLDRSQGGLGIGLTLVKKLVELHGGEIEARSAGPGQGSEFIVDLPLDAHLPSEQRTPATRDDLRPFDAKRIVVVDDNADAAESLALLLELDGHQVKTVFDGLMVFDLVADFRPDVVFLDIGLPGMDGYRIAERLRACLDTRDALLIAITGYGRQEDKRQAETAGFDYHLVKPIDPGDLSRLLAECRSRPPGCGEDAAAFQSMGCLTGKTLSLVP